MKLVIFPIQGGNVQSLKRAFERIGCDALIASTIADLEDATHLVLPGIGSFEKAMQILETKQWKQALLSKINDQNTFTLGICLGMQLLTDSSEESTGIDQRVEGLKFIPGVIKRFEPGSNKTIKIPHTGWNTVEMTQENQLLKDLDPTDSFYFLHAYHVSNLDYEFVLGTTTYGNTFPSVIQKGRCYGVQFHPEKSHEAGRKSCAIL